MTELRFDDTGRYIMREAQPYMMDYPFGVMSMKLEVPVSMGYLIIAVKCKKCDTEDEFRFLSVNNVFKPFQTMMGVTKTFFERHWTHDNISLNLNSLREVRDEVMKGLDDETTL